MKTAFVGLGLAAVATSADAVNYDVASCAELADIDHSTVTSLTVTSVYFECDSYTRFPVHNDMTLRSDTAVVFTNFALEVLGNLTVAPDVTFRDVTEQETDGGALYVKRGSSATFLGETHFLQNTVISADLPSTSSGARSDDSDYIIRSGGAIFNEGELVFEDIVKFAENRVLTTASTDVGSGGAIYNAGTGTIAFEGPLTALWNIASGSYGGKGGAIFNVGEILVASTSSFAGNTAAEDGGAIYVHPNGTITFNDYASFKENKCYEKKGGAIFNLGSLGLMGGSLFKGNVAASSDDGGSGGGIYNGGEGSLSFGGSNTFDHNWGFKGGAIYNEAEASILPLEDGDELEFPSIRGTNCPGIYYEPVGNADAVCGP